MLAEVRFQVSFRSFILPNLKHANEPYYCFSGYAGYIQGIASENVYGKTYNMATTMQ